MAHSLSLITTVAAAFGLALVLGFIAVGKHIAQTLAGYGVPLIAMVDHVLTTVREKPAG